MRVNVWCLLLLLLIAPGLGIAAPDPASTASARTLFETMGMRRMLDAKQQEVQLQFNSSLNAQLAQPLSEQQRSYVEGLGADMATFIPKVFADIELRVLEVFTETLTGPEIEALAAFCRSDIGQRFVQAAFEGDDKANQLIESFSPSELQQLEGLSVDSNMQTLARKGPQLKANAARVLQEFADSLPARFKEVARRRQEQR